MKENELKEITGGVSASFLSAIVRGITSIYDIGRRVGSYIIRYATNKICQI